MKLDKTRVEGRRGGVSYGHLTRLRPISFVSCIEYRRRGHVGGCGWRGREEEQLQDFTGMTVL